MTQTGFVKKSKVDMKPETQQRITEPVKESPKVDEWEVVAWINTLNLYDKVSGKYTEAINPNTIVVKTNDLTNSKVIGYISVVTLEAFLNGEKRSVPIKIKKVN